MTNTDHDHTGERLSIFGVGPRFVLLSLVVTLVVVPVRVLWPEFAAFPYLPRSVLIIGGAALLAVGLPFFVWSLVTLLRGFSEGRLFTGGPYAMCRHPVYGCWVVFNVPGIILLVNSWIGLLVPLAMYVTLRVLVRTEEADLERLFGEEYRRYRERTPAVFPAFWLLWQ